ncbi:RWD domain-containing protein 2B-like [Haliotis asinina]|uniref:RWD domain-containing protein 2B-like n=1 Tax=Haliotis asinina TaxID=109174 RepID=UPI003531AAA9
MPIAMALIMENEDPSSVDLKETLELQLSEVEMLQSMFPNPGEFKMEDGPESLEEIQAFLDNKMRAEFLESRIGFIVKITTSKKTAELVCHLPHDYPHASPEVFLRSHHLNRETHTQLNEDLNEFLTTLDRGEICIGSLIEWLQENLPHYAQIQDTPVQQEKKALSKEDTVFTRLWIYSHHIFSKFKRRDILAWASELKVTGFCMPGKPGVICIEGYSSEVDEFWYRLRRLNWKKIAIKEKEDEEMGKKNITYFRKFSTFEEVGFDVRGGKGREYHMDLGKFYEFLEEHKCGKIFSLYFGVEGKSGPAE